MPAQSPAALPRDPASANTRPEWFREAVLILLVIAAGIGLRLAYPSRMAVEHFDEGVYASNRWFGEREDYQYPNRYLYAPPLLPALIEWSFVLFGPSNFAAILPSLVAGCLTVPLVWWVVRGWLGPRIALAAALLVAGSDLHIAFSRAALTDVLVLFWIIAAVGVGSRAFVNRSPLAAIGAGILTGLAWWTKYNGWLPLAILGSGGAAWALIPGRVLSQDDSRNKVGSANLTADAVTFQSRLRRLLMVVALWCLMAAVAGAVWYPCLKSLQASGGYSAVAANHRGYFVGWSGWFNSLRQQGWNLGEFGGWLTVFSASLAVLLPGLVPVNGTAGFTWNRRELLMRLAVTFFFASGMSYPGILFLCFGALSIGLCLWFGLRGKTGSLSPATTLAYWLLAAWFTGMLLTTPLYTPYVRLTFPWWTSGLIAISILSVEMSACCQVTAAIAEGRLPEDSFGLGHTNWWKRYFRVNALMGLAGLLLLVSYVFILGGKGTPGWENRTTVQIDAKEMMDDVRADLRHSKDGLGGQFAIYTYGEPALLFQLRLSGAENVVPVQHLRFADPGGPRPVVPSYVVIGPQAMRTNGFKEQFERARPRLREVETYWPVNSLLVRCDELAQRQRGNNHLPELDDKDPALILYSVMP